MICMARHLEADIPLLARTTRVISFDRPGEQDARGKACKGILAQVRLPFHPSDGEGEGDLSPAIVIEY
jgi:hypothetical protein